MRFISFVSGVLLVLFLSFCELGVAQDESAETSAGDGVVEDSSTESEQAAALPSKSTFSFKGQRGGRVSITDHRSGTETSVHPYGYKLQELSPEARARSAAYRARQQARLDAYQKKQEGKSTGEVEEELAAGAAEDTATAEEKAGVAEDKASAEEKAGVSDEKAPEDPDQ